MYKYAKQEAPKPEVEFYTPDDIMIIMQISRSTAYKLFRSDGFPGIKINGMFRVEKKKFEAWAESYAGKTFLTD